jgi:transketolase
MSEIVKPLSIPTQLANTPKTPPRYTIQVKTTSGHTYDAADPKANRAMVALMDMAAVIGGAASHWGGPSAFAELMSAAYAVMFQESKQQKKDWTELFHFVNDAGHCENGLYALMANYNHAGVTLETLKGFRSIDSVLTGHGESHLFPEGVLISNGPLGSSLPQAQGLAMADRWSGRNRVTVTAVSDGACMEGEAREALAAISGLAAQKKLAPFVMIISDNNTKLSGRIDQDSFSMKGTFASLAPLGWNVIQLDKAHDLKECIETLERAVELAKKDPTKPVAIHAKTIKGFGVKKTAESASGGHGFPLKKAAEVPAFLEEIYAGSPVPLEFMKWAEELKTLEAKAAPASAPGTQKVQVGVAKALIEKRKQGLPVVSISSDLPGSTGVADFQKAFPECTQDMGVAESNMISAAAGCSKLGFIPVVDTFSQFGVTKGALPLTMASLSEAPVIGIFSHAGFQDAADGASHQALTYLSMTSSIPNVNVYCLATSDEAEALVGQAVDGFAVARRAGKIPPTSLFFLGRENFVPTVLPKDFTYKLGQAQVVLDTSADHKTSVCIVAAGPMVHQALQAATVLASQGIGVVVVNPSIINRPDVATLKAALAKTGGRLVTVEDHQDIGGMGALLVHALVSVGVSLKLKSLGVDGEFGRSAYLADELYQLHGIDAASIAKAASTLAKM